MAAATDQQMQQFSDQRVRVRAEALRAVINALRDDKSSIDDVYARAVSATPWSDSRTDGPPKLATQQDILTFNAIATDLLACIDGTATTQQVSDLHSNWQIFMAMCVRPLS